MYGKGAGEGSGGDFVRNMEMYKKYFIPTRSTTRHGIHRIPMQTNSRGSKGRLPLHCAAECLWANNAMLRLMVKKFLAASYIPVVPPFGQYSGGDHR